MGFTKLDENILDSSIMAESPETFKVWICLLAACREDGIARISSVGVASRCYLSIDVAKKSLDILQSPDSESRSTNDNGIRVRRVDGGFEIVNYFKYRAYLYSDNHEAVKKRKQRNGGQKGTCPQMSPNSGDISASASASVFEGDARGNISKESATIIENESNDGKTKKNILVEKQSVTLPWNTETFVSAWSRWNKYKKKQHGFRFKCFDSEQSALNKLKRMCDTEKRALDAIEYSIASGYQGIFEERKNTYKPITYASKELMIEPDYHQKAPKREIPVKQPIPEDMFDSDGHLIIKQLSEQEIAEREAARVEHANNYMAKLKKAIHEKGKLSGGKY